MPSHPMVSSSPSVQTSLVGFQIGTILLFCILVWWMVETSTIMYNTIHALLIMYFFKGYYLQKWRIPRPTRYCKNDQSDDRCYGSPDAFYQPKSNHIDGQQCSI